MLFLMKFLVTGVINFNNKLNATKLDTCWCEFFATMRLPCKHILALRSHLNIDIFDKNICDKRWSKVYQKPSFSKDNYLPGASNQNPERNQPPNQNRPTSQLQKYAKVTPILNNIGEYVSEKSQQAFNIYILKV